MSIKTYLQGLLESFLVNKKAVVSSYAAPKSSASAINLDASLLKTNGWSDSFTASCDGFLVAGVLSATGAVTIELSAYGCGTRQSAYKIGTNDTTATIPICKGSLYNVYIYTASSYGSVFLKLIPSGGSM
jgi:hypothetical protein